MTDKIGIRSVRIEWLDSRCLAQISKYAKLAHDHDGIIMNLRDDDILQQVNLHVRQTDNAQLKQVYQELKVGIKTRLGDPKLFKHVSKQTIPDYLIEESEEGRVPRSEVISRWFRSSKMAS